MPWQGMQFTLKNAPPTLARSETAGEAPPAMATVGAGLSAVGNAGADAGVRLGAVGRVTGAAARLGAVGRVTGAAARLGAVGRVTGAGPVGAGEGAAAAATAAAARRSPGATRLERANERDHVLDIGMREFQLVLHRQHQLPLALQNRMSQVGVGTTSLPLRIRKIRNDRHGFPDDTAPAVEVVAGEADGAEQLHRSHPAGSRGGRCCRGWCCLRWTPRRWAGRRCGNGARCACGRCCRR